MPSRYTHDVVATVGEYTDRQTGQQKKRYTTCGKAFTDDQGRISLKLDTIPVVPEWSGWLSLYPAERRDAPQQPQGGRRQAAPAPATQAAAHQEEEDDIPF